MLKFNWRKFFNPNYSKNIQLLYKVLSNVKEQYIFVYSFKQTIAINNEDEGI